MGSVKTSFSKNLPFLVALYRKVRRSGLVRGLENRIRFSGRLYVNVGDTNSTFFRPGWRTVDMVDADYISDLREKGLPLGEGTVDAFYSSHLVEHISKEAGRRLYREFFRCLKPEGVVRISTPDLKLEIEKYRAGDWRHFLANEDGKFVFYKIEKGFLEPDSLLMHNRLVSMFASYCGREDTAGGPIVDKETVDEKLEELDIYEFRDWCVSLLDRSRKIAHVHVADFDEIARDFEDAGLVDVKSMTFSESDYGVFLNPTIDRDIHVPYSMYVEAKKPAP